MHLFSYSSVICLLMLITIKQARAVHNSVMELRNFCNHPYLSQLHAEEVCCFLLIHFVMLVFHRMKVGGQGYCLVFVGLLIFLVIFVCLQVDNLIPKHYLPPIVRLCGKLEMLDRLLPKLKATNHRVWINILLYFSFVFVV